MLGKYNRRTVRASSGAVAPGAIVSFFWQSNGTPAMVYADQDGNNPLGSSVQSDDDGRIAVFVTPGLYRIVTTLDGSLIDELTHEPIVGQLAYADPDSYALRSELKLHDEDIQLVAKSLVELKLAGGPRLASGRVLSVDEIGMLADTGAMIKTTEYHEGTSIGGGEYQLRTRASYRTEIGDAAWVPDGYGDHYLLGGAEYVATLSRGNQYNLAQFGADSTGATVSNQQVQAFFDRGGELLVSAGEYLIDPVDPDHGLGSLYEGGVRPREGSIIQFDSGARFIAQPNDKGSYVIINWQEDNVTIIDGVCVGDVESHTNTGGEYGFGFYIRGAKNPRAIRCRADKCWGDGFYVAQDSTTSVHTEGGILFDCNADSNRRQGLSIISWVGGVVMGGLYSNTGQILATNPAFGIDIEPNPDADDRIDVSLIGVRTKGNYRGGLSIVPGFMATSGYTSRDFNVTVVGFKSEDDNDITGGGAGLFFAYPALTSALVNQSNKIGGRITIKDVEIRNPGTAGMAFERWAGTAPDLHLENLSIYNCNRIETTATTALQCAVTMRTDDGTYQVDTGRMTMTNVGAFDSRPTKKMLIPIWFAVSNTGTQAVTNFYLKNYFGELGSSLVNGPVRINKSSGCLIEYDKPDVRVFSANTTLLDTQFAGSTLVLSVATAITLPLASTVIGLEVIADNRNGVLFQMNPNAADTIKPLGVSAGSGIVLRSTGDWIKLRATANNTWETVGGSTGFISPVGYDRPRNNMYATAAPSTGTWVAGDKVFSSAPSPGGAEGWICTASGSPGTWKAFGSIAL